MQNLAEIFPNPAILAAHQNKNLRGIIGTKLIENKVKRKSMYNLQGNCAPSLANNRTLRCKQVPNRTRFRSNQPNRIFLTYRNLNYKSKYLIYLL